MLAKRPSATPPVADGAVGVDTSGGVRFVAVRGSGLEETFPRPGVKTVGGTALPASASPSTLSSPLTGNIGGVWEDGGVARATTAAASTQAPELKMSDWVNARRRCGNVLKPLYTSSPYFLVLYNTVNVLAE